MKKNNIGTRRFVLIFERIVIKFPRINNFFENLRINFMEFIYYIIYRSDFCMPTYFSFFGFFTIQKRGKNWGYCDEINDQLVVYSNSIKKYIESENLNKYERQEIAHDSHSNNNLFWDGNKLKYVDYGSSSMFRFIKFCIKNKTLSA